VAVFQIAAADKIKCCGNNVAKQSPQSSSGAEEKFQG